MTSPTVLGRYVTPDGQEMVLELRDGRYTILVGDAELMSSSAHGSEEVMAQRTGELLNAVESPRILIGGLGMGYTLRAALNCLSPTAVIEVAEVFEEVVEWCRGPLAHLAGDPLSDPRAKVRLADISTLLQTENGTYDAILLDIDNGPTPFTLASNTRFYSLHGLARLHARLRPGGILMVWSASPDRPFERRLRRSGFTVETETIRADPGTTWPRHTLFLART